MKGLVRKPYTLIALLPALLLGSCTCNPDSVNRGDVNVISVEQEWQMGEQFAAEVSRQVTLVADPVVQGFVAQLGEQIVAETELAGQDWQFYVVADPALNAFALPGGHVYVTTGLIAAASGPSELAGVMGHEIAHVVARHHSERLTKVYGLNFAARLLMGEDPGMVEQIVAQIVGSGVVAKFSRNDERESDRLGLRFMHDAGYAPTAMATMFEALLAQRERRPTLVERFFASHPLTEERIANVEEMAEDFPPESAPASSDSAFRQVQQRVEQAR